MDLLGNPIEDVYLQQWKQEINSLEFPARWVGNFRYHLTSFRKQKYFIIYGKDSDYFLVYQIAPLLKKPVKIMGQVFDLLIFNEYILSFHSNREIQSWPLSSIFTKTQSSLLGYCPQLPTDLRPVFNKQQDKLIVINLYTKYLQLFSLCQDGIQCENLQTKDEIYKVEELNRQEAKFCQDWMLLEGVHVLTFLSFTGEKREISLKCEEIEVHTFSDSPYLILWENRVNFHLFRDFKLCSSYRLQKERSPSFYYHIYWQYEIIYILDGGCPYFLNFSSQQWYLVGFGYRYRNKLESTMLNFLCILYLGLNEKSFFLQEGVAELIPIIFDYL